MPPGRPTTALPPMPQLALPHHHYFLLHTACSQHTYLSAELLPQPECHKSKDLSGFTTEYGGLQATASIIPNDIAHQRQRDRCQETGYMGKYVTL